MYVCTYVCMYVCYVCMYVMYVYMLCMHACMHLLYIHISSLSLLPPLSLPYSQYRLTKRLPPHPKSDCQDQFKYVHTYVHTYLNKYIHKCVHTCITYIHT